MKRLIHSLALCLVMSIVPVFSQQAVTNVVTEKSADTPIYYNNRWFSGSVQKVVGFYDENGDAYSLLTSPASTVYVRRNLGGWGVANNTSISLASGPGDTTLTTYSQTVQTALAGNNLYSSVDNVFTNGNSASQGNIERLDFKFSSGVQVDTTTYLAVFDRGLANQHDAFSIALISGWTRSNTPIYSGSVLTVLSTAYGATNALVNGASFSYSYNLFRYEDLGDNLISWTENYEMGTQGVGGVVINLDAFFNSPANYGTIYGYSIFANDTTTNINQLRNYTRYPSDSTNGLDLINVNGQVFKKVPVIPESPWTGLVIVSLILSIYVYAMASSKKH